MTSVNCTGVVVVAVGVDVAPAGRFPHTEALRTVTRLVSETRDVQIARPHARRVRADTCAGAHSFCALVVCRTTTRTLG